MHREESKFQTIDGLELYSRWWLPEKEFRSLVLIVHGIAEHGDRYQHVAEFLTAHGYAVAAFDLRGHGYSQGERCWIDIYDKYLDDLESFLAQVKQRYPAKKIFLLGHSMGAGIVPLYLITRTPLQELSGILLSGAPVKISENISPLLQKISGILSFLAPRMRTIKLSSAGLSHDQAVVNAYDNDPLVTREKLYARVGAELIRTTRRIQANMEAIHHPILMMHGSQDPLSDPQGSRELYQRVGSSDKTLKIYEGFYHEILNEVQKQLVLDDILLWLDAHQAA